MVSCFISFTPILYKGSKMRDTIIYVGGFRLPNFNASAVRVMENACLLKSLGYDVVILGKLQEVEGEIVHYAVHDGFDCYDIRQPFKNGKYAPYTKSIASIEAVVKHIGTEKVKAIIAYNYPALALHKLVTYSRKNGIAPVSDCTEWYGWEGTHLLRNIRRFVDTRYRMHFSAKRAANIICAGSYLESFFKDYNTVSWPFCVNTELERWKLSDTVAVHHPRVFVYSGSPGMGMSKDKINLIIEILYDLKLEGKNFKYIVLGITKVQYLEHFETHEKMIEFMGESIEFKGRVPHTEALSTLKNADFSLFIRPDTRVSHAGFPTKVMEAFTSGIPTIANATSDIPKYVKNTINGFIFKSSDAEDIKATLLESLEMSDEALLAMKLQCREENPFAIENFKKSVGEFLDRTV